MSSAPADQKAPEPDQASRSPSEPLAPAGESARRLFWRRFRRDRVAVFSGVALLVIMAAVVFGGPIAAAILGHGPDAIFPAAVDIGLNPVGPMTRVPDTYSSADVTSAETTLLVLGADGPLGRDELLRLLYGGRVSLLVAVGGALLAMSIGVLIGGSAALIGGKFDWATSRLTELVMAFPVLFFIILLSSTVGGRISKVTLAGTLPQGVLALVLIIGTFAWFYPARIVRAEIASLREREFVDAARVMGSGEGRILRQHLFPHLVTPLVVYATLLIPTFILLEAGISFLGFGVPLPESSWGNMLATSWGSVREPRADPFAISPWVTFFPTIAIFVTVLAFNLFGEGLRAAADPESAR
jgi:peptide/nickel transport system permease protein